MRPDRRRSVPGRERARNPLSLARPVDSAERRRSDHAPVGRMKTKGVVGCGGRRRVLRPQAARRPEGRCLGRGRTTAALSAGTNVSTSSRSAESAATVRAWPANQSATATTPAATAASTRPAPHGRHATALRATRPDDLQQRARPPAHQEGGPPRPHTPPVRRRLPTHDPRPSVIARSAPPRSLTPRATAQSRAARQARAQAAAPAEALDGARSPRATIQQGGCLT